ncbi:unnamed protein product, partial [Prunus brigantina]
MGERRRRRKENRKVELNMPELDVESVLGAGAGAGNANVNGADELKSDGDEACLNTEGDDDEVVKRLGEVES